MKKYVGTTTTIIEVYEAVLGDDRGEHGRGIFYKTPAEASKNSASFDPNPRPLQRFGVMVDNTQVWLLEKGPIFLYETHGDYLRTQALAKLTYEEKVALGLI